MDERRLFLQSCAAIEEARDLIGLIAQSNPHSANATVQSAASQAMAALDRLVSELRKEHNPVVPPSSPPFRPSPGPSEE